MADQPTQHDEDQPDDDEQPDDEVVADKTALDAASKAGLLAATPGHEDNAPCRDMPRPHRGRW